MQPPCYRLPDSLDPEPAVCVEQAAAVEHRKGADVLGPDLIRPQHDLWSSAVSRSIGTIPAFATSIGQWRGHGQGRSTHRVRAPGLLFSHQIWSNVSSGRNISVSGHHEAAAGSAGQPHDRRDARSRSAGNESKNREILNRWPAVGLAVAASATDASSSPTATSLPTSFRIALPWFEIGTDRVIFSREPGVGTTAVHLDFAPLSFQKQTARTNPRLWAAARSGGRWPPLHRQFSGEADNN